MVIEQANSLIVDMGIIMNFTSAELRPLLAIFALDSQLPASLTFSDLTPFYLAKARDNNRERKNAH